MEIQELYIAQLNTPLDQWIDVNTYGNGRNNTCFLENQQVYIIAIIKKISNQREKLTENIPNQYSYEQIDWK
jgi:hypothetical protein